MIILVRSAMAFGDDAILQSDSLIALSLCLSKMIFFFFFLGLRPPYNVSMKRGRLCCYLEARKAPKVVDRL
jgi:hypothetical protein